jgi:hypothetical protein
MTSFPNRRRGRIILCGIAFVAVTLITFLLYQNGPDAPCWPGCLFHRWTGFLCPGCGMTRATHAALHGHFSEAFRFNPLGMLAVPALIAWLGIQIPHWIRDPSRPLRFTIGPTGARWILAVLLAYWILRNVPVWPFTLWAPP